MDFYQIAIIVLLFMMLALYAHGKYRYDLVAIGGLLLATFVGLVPFEDAFMGFAHPAVITVIAVLILSRALFKAGIVDVVAGSVAKVGDNLTVQLLVLMLMVTLSSAFINNVGALALMMPVAIKMAREHDRPPSLYLMPLAFGSLLGGMTTLIGTPPNIIIATYRAEALGRAPFGMFAFFPVGGVIAVAGIVVMLIISRFVLPERKGKLSREEMFEIHDYLTQIKVTEKSKIEGKRVAELERATAGDIAVVGHIRDGKRFSNVTGLRALKIDDRLIVRGSAGDVQQLLKKTGLELSESDKLPDETASGEHIDIIEVSVTATSDLIDRTAKSLNLRSRFNVNLLGVARSGGRIRATPGAIRFKPGDVLLLQGEEGALQHVIGHFTLLPLQSRALQLGNLSSLVWPLFVFFLAILLAVFNVLPPQISFMAAVVVLVFSKRITLKETYDAVDWPIVVLLGAMIPIATALETTGTAALLAEGIASIAADGQAAWLLIGLLVLITMLLSNVVNNATAALLMAPIAVGIAQTLGHSIDPYLMSIAVGASAAFLTPIGHQSNTLVMTPAGYRFTDYAKLGLPLSLLVLVLSVPMILWVFPIT